LIAAIQKEKEKFDAALIEGDAQKYRTLGAEITKKQQSLEKLLDHGDLLPINDGHFAKLIADYQPDMIRVSPGEPFRVYDGTRWCIDHDSSLAREHVLKSVRDFHARWFGHDKLQKRIATYGDGGHPGAVVKNFRAVRRLRVPVDKWDADPLLFNVENGTIDLRDRNPETRLHPDRFPEKYITRIAPVAYIAGADCPEWKAAVRKYCSAKDGTPRPELERYLQRYLGACLSNRNGAQVFLVAVGPGENGKTTVMMVMHLLLGGGQYSKQAPRTLFLGKKSDRQEVATGSVVEYHFVFVDENLDDDDPKAAIEMLKTFTNQTTSAWHLFQGYKDHQIHCKIMLGLNKMPKIDLTLHANDRRFVPFPFDWVVPAEEKVQDYHEVLVEKEGPGILNWLIDGFHMGRDMGSRALHPDVVPEIKTLRDRYRGQFDETGVLWGKIADFGEDLYEPSGNIIPSYKAACEHEMVEPMSVPALKAWLNAHSCRAGRLNDKDRTRIWGGLRLKDEWRVVPTKKAKAKKGAPDGTDGT
jgi:putative DNA primase/helicase